MINRCHYGDCRDGLREMIKAGIKAQTCITSPPYWNLRDYGVPGQIGLERTLYRYMATIRHVFRLVGECLADDGTLWLNLGDLYSSSGGGGRINTIHGNKLAATTRPDRHRKQNGIKAKDLIGIPWMIAFVLRTDGWYLRSDIIWSKPNPLPESVQDRPTRSHEYIFLMTKSPKYYYDSAAIREPAKETIIDKHPSGWDSGDGGYRTKAGRYPTGAAIDRGQRASLKQRGHGRRHDGFNDRWDHMTKADQQALGRNKRDVWSVATQPFAGAHFATFPKKLIEPCVLAGSRPGDLVLDPFMGSGTVAEVCQDLGRDWIGFELNPEYEALIAERARQRGLQI